MFEGVAWRKDIIWSQNSNKTLLDQLFIQLSAEVYQWAVLGCLNEEE